MKPLAIVKRHNLSNTFISQISGVDRYTTYVYCNLDHSNLYSVSIEKIETAVMEWYKQLIKNRCRLLKSTQYAHLYCNIDGIKE